MALAVSLLRWDEVRTFVRRMTTNGPNGLGTFLTALNNWRTPLAFGTFYRCRRGKEENGLVGVVTVNLSRFSDRLR